jgi:hypothetical protein
MEMLCPECLGPLITSDGRTARCTLHGGEYRILFLRGQPAAEPVAAESLALPVEAAPKTVFESPPAMADSPYRSPAHEVQVCVRHPDVETSVSCARCGVPICLTCRFPQADGTQLCPECVTKVRAWSGTVREVPEGVMCAQHQQVQAEHYCKSCRAPICGTCDFALPGGVHVCPDCATKTNRGLSSKRKTLLGWGYALAVWCTIGLVLLFGGAAAGMFDEPGGEEAIGMLFSVFVFIPSLVGTALSVAVLDRRLSNPPFVWIAIVWNALILAILLLLTIVGTFAA